MAPVQPHRSHNGVALIDGQRTEELDMRQQHLVTTEEVHLPWTAPPTEQKVGANVRCFAADATTNFNCGMLNLDHRALT
jgi:hypothetical protein